MARKYKAKSIDRLHPASSVRDLPRASANHQHYLKNNLPRLRKSTAGHRQLSALGLVLAVD
jgi:hypothetical protein